MKKELTAVVLVGLIVLLAIQYLRKNTQDVKAALAPVRIGGVPSPTPSLQDEWRRIIQLVGLDKVDRTYGSHSVVLLAAVIATTGDIVEFGSGFFSTPMLHKYSQDVTNGKRHILTADSNKKWLDKFMKYRTNFHQLRLVSKTEDWADIARGCGNYSKGVIFIDHAPAGRRVVDLMRVDHCSQIVVLHDSQQLGYYNYRPGLARYKYSYKTGRLFGSEVTALSNYNGKLVDKVRLLVQWYLQMNNTKT